MSRISLRSFRTARLRMALLSGLVLAGCSKDDILQPDLPDIIDGTALNNSQGAPAIYAGAVSEMQLALTSNLGAILASGLFTDELEHSSTPPAVREWDLRAVTSANSVGTGTALAPGPFLMLHRARTALESAAERVTPYFPANDARIGELYALSGMAHIVVGEIFCSGAPFSERSPDLALGPPLSTADILNRGLARLATAATKAGSDPRITNLIAVLQGRANLDLGQFSQAATAVAGVPTSYIYQVFHSTTTQRQNNQLFLQNDNDIYSVSDKEGTNGLDFATAGDPRLPAVLSSRTGTGVSRNDGVTLQYYFTKYTSSSDPVTVASGIEARLIEAEAALQAADPGTWLNKLNEARATVAGLAPLTDPGSAEARVDLTFRERAFWLYLTGHRLGDLRRLVRQYGRAAESVYPTGAYHKQGLTRGTQLNLIVPNTEENNSEYAPSDCTVNAP